MSTAAEKAKIVKKVLTELKKKHGDSTKAPTVPLLEHMVIAVLAEDALEAPALAAYEHLRDSFYDWNEVRVSTVKELRQILRDLPSPDIRAVRLKSALKYIFEAIYSFDIDGWRKSTMKDVTMKLGKMSSPSHYVTNRVIRDGMKGKVFPIDGTAERVLRRVGVIEPKMKVDAMTASIDRMIPSGRSHELTCLIAEHGIATCHEINPLCSKCVLLSFCPAGQEELVRAKEEAAQKRAAKKLEKAANARSSSKSKARASAKKSASKPKTKSKSASKPTAKSSKVKKKPTAKAKPKTKTKPKTSVKAKSKPSTRTTVAARKKSRKK